MENHAELETLFDEYKETERRRQREQSKHSELLSIIRENQAQSSSKTKLASSEGSNSNPSSISASGTGLFNENVRANNLLKKRIGIYKEGVEKLNVNKGSVEQRKFLNKLKVVNAKSNK